MLIKYITWHRVDVICKKDPSISCCIDDAMVTCIDGACTIRAKEQSHTYGQAKILSFDMDKMCIAANWFSCTYDAKGNTSDEKLIPVDIICYFEFR